MADWTNCLRDAKMYTFYELQRWTVVTPERHFNDTKQFLNALTKVSQGMNFPLRYPTMYVYLNLIIIYIKFYSKLLHYILFHLFINVYITLDIY